MEYTESFEDRFKGLRKDRNLTQGDIARDLGVSKATVAMWETGRRTPPLKKMREIAEYFNCRLDYLLGTSDDAWTDYYEYEEAEQYVKMSAAAEDADQAINFYSDFFRKIVTLDEYGWNTVRSVVESEAKRCREQASFKEKPWLHVTVDVDMEHFEVKEDLEGIDMEGYWDYLDKMAEIQKDD